MHKPLPKWLHTYGHPGKGQTRAIVLQVFKQASEYGVSELWPSQIYGGAIELYEYNKSKASINEALKGLLADNIVERCNGGYRLIDGKGVKP